MNEQSFKSNISNVNVWIRVLYMLVFALLMVAARFVLCLISVLQALLVLIGGEDNLNLRNLGQGTSKWVYQGLLFLTFNSEQKPFPFSDWPDVEPVDAYRAPVQAESPAPITAETDPTEVAVDKIEGDFSIDTDDSELNASHENNAKNDKKTD